MVKIKKDDEVIVIAGKDKGKQGRVLDIVGKDRLLIDSINLVKKHVKPNPNKGDTGGIVEKEASIHQSNIAIYNPATKKADRVGIKIEKDGKKARVYKSSGELIDT